MRRMLSGLSLCGGQLLGVAVGWPAEVPGAPAGEDPRPVILVQQEIHDTSPFAAAQSGGSNDVVRLPPVPSTRWKPETRWEPPVRVERAAESRSDGGWQSVTPVVMTTPITPDNHSGLTKTAAPGPASAAAAPIVAGVAPVGGSRVDPTRAPLYVVPAEVPASQPNQPYAIGGVQPRMPVARPDSRYLARNVWGEQTQYVVGQHMRNAVRFLVP